MFYNELKSNFNMIELMGVTFSPSEYFVFLLFTIPLHFLKVQAH